MSSKEQTNTPQTDYQKFAKSNSLHLTLILIFKPIYLFFLILNCVDVHWAQSTDANPLYLTFNQYIYIGIWSRCDIYFKN